MHSIVLLKEAHACACSAVAPAFTFRIRCLGHFRCEGFIWPVLSVLLVLSDRLCLQKGTKQHAQCMTSRPRQ